MAEIGQSSGTWALRIDLAVTYYSLFYKVISHQNLCEYEKRRDDHMTEGFFGLSFLYLQKVIRQTSPICNLLLTTLRYVTLVDIILWRRSKYVEEPFACITNF